MTAPAKSLKGVRLAISISASPDLPRLGLSDLHLQDAFVEVSRYILASEGEPAYGGDLRKGGYTELLFDLMKTYADEHHNSSPRAHNYLSWPISLDLAPAHQASWAQVMQFHLIDPPKDVAVDSTKPLPPTTPENRVAWARCLTEMRKRMAAECNARVLLGGPIAGFLGRYPGLLEEALESLKASKPIFLVGGYGGCVGSIIRAIRGEPVPEFDEAHQRSSAEYDALFKTYESHLAQAKVPDTIDWPGVVKTLKVAGIQGLNNGLSAAENDRLFSSVYVQEIVLLILRGLTRLRALKKL